MRRRRAGRRCSFRLSNGDADSGQSVCFAYADTDAKAEADQGVEQLGEGHRHWRLWGNTQGQGRRAMGN
jgi:hypothetical protein